MFKLRLFLRRHFPKKGAQRTPKNDFFLLYPATIITPFRVHELHVAKRLGKIRLPNSNVTEGNFIWFDENQPSFGG